MSNMSVPLTLNLAVLGRRACGKTVLLSCYYGQRSAALFKKQHRYYLSCPDTDRAKADRLLRKYEEIIDQLHFPDADDSFSLYQFNFHVADVDEPAFKLIWGDYPGGWFTQVMTGKADEEKRNSALQYLLTCNMAMLLLDGEEFLKKKEKYLSSEFRNFREEIERQKEAMRGRGISPKFPDRWVICLTKADLFGSDYTAQRFRDACNAPAPLAEIEEIGRFVNNGTIGRHFLLLSAVKGEAGKVIDPNASMGLELIAPLVFDAILRELKQQFQKKGEQQPDWLLRILAKLFGTTPEKRVKEIEENAQKARQQGNILDAALLFLLSPLQTESAKRLYYHE